MKYQAMNDWEIERAETAREIIIDDQQPQWSGLYDASGQKLYRLPDRIPIGFMPNGNNRSKDGCHLPCTRTHERAKARN